jgi:hypothetical protein
MPTAEKKHQSIWLDEDRDNGHESEDQYRLRLKGEEKGHVTLQDISDIESSKESKLPSGSRSKAEKEDIFVDSPSGVTTLTLLNIPEAYTEEGMLMELYQVVGREMIDFFFMPWDFAKKTNCGYAIVNFTMPFATMQCIQGLSGKKFGLVQTSNVCSVLPAEIQGISANLESYKNRFFEDVDHCPKVYKNGKQVDIKESYEEHCRGVLIDARIPSVSELSSKLSKHTVSTTSEGHMYADNLADDDAYSESGCSSRTGSEMSGSHYSSETGSSCGSLSTVEPGVLSNFAARFG